jgi:hypothetical protein
VLLERIREFITQINPPCVELHVKNPIYEEIFVRFNVRFHPGVDPGFYSRLLNDEIKGFLAPWAFEALEISFGATIEASVILNFIEKRSYVDYITCFEMDQITPTETLKNIQLAKAHSGASILTSVEQHEIYVLETDDCECDDNIVSAPKAAANCSCGCDGTASGHGSNGSGQSNTGVGAGSVGNNFIVGNGASLGNDGVGSMGIDNDFEIG